MPLRNSTFWQIPLRWTWTFVVKWKFQRSTLSIFCWWIFVVLQKSTKSEEKNLIKTAFIFTFWLDWSFQCRIFSRILGENSNPGCAVFAEIFLYPMPCQFSCLEWEKTVVKVQPPTLQRNTSHSVRSQRKTIVNHWYSITLPIAKILSAKNVRAWVSMVSYLNK